MLKVSVVVPVYNAGPYLERCAPSLLGQSLGEDEYEIVYVDDGSTDGSAEVLDRLAAEHPRIRVHHQENSGWPGKPRNVGVAMARGEYIQFVDQDDRLTPEALERLYAMGSRNGSDIVLGKMAGSMVGPSPVFRRNRERCTVEDAPLIETLTAHRLFRRAFLEEAGLRFPEGYWRMEDLLFMVRAYPRAKVVSILADYPCYIWDRRDDGGNNSRAAFDRLDNLRRLRMIIEALADATEPGELQDRLMRRLYRVELMRYVPAYSASAPEDEERRAIYETTRSMALECFPPGVTEGMPAVQRLRATLLAEDRHEALDEVARRVSEVRPRIELLAAEQDAAGRLSMNVRATFQRTGVGPLALAGTEDGGYVLDPAFTEGIEGAGDLPVLDPTSYANGEVFVHDLRRNVWWHAEDTLLPQVESLGDGLSQVVVEGGAVIDPLTLAGGEPLEPGTYEVWFGVQVLGVGRRPRLTPADAAQRVALGSVPLGTTGRTVRADWSGRGGQLRLIVTKPKPAPKPPPTGLRRIYRGALRRLPPRQRKAVRRYAAAVRRRLPGQS
ncbi:glycosyltransferase family A protein [Streptomyces sp. NBC_00102]|uniref:glycosyltransferase family A protein n=1 Tax=Streptomyces sp. NBC_00102 TaxID=2975652 RepID=UPI00224EF531|nr:glycosyltransferase family A protein [Streptomyces sp. NBC_00102]MCX5396998.1 glycosyltransferase family 2 protein [Streptomyces sp. NBC_00102]